VIGGGGGKKEKGKKIGGRGGERESPDASPPSYRSFLSLMGEGERGRKKK